MENSSAERFYAVEAKAKHFRKKAWFEYAGFGLLFVVSLVGVIDASYKIGAFDLLARTAKDCAQDAEKGV